MKEIIYVTNDSERALGLEELLPNFSIIATDYNHIAKTIESKGINIFTLEKELDEKNPIFRNSAKLLEHPKTEEFLKQNLQEPSNTYVMTFKISPQFERTLEKYGFQSLNSTSQLNRKFENKISQYHFLQELGITTPEASIIRLEQLDPTQYSEKKIVVQYDRGHSGNSTFFVSDRKSLEKLIKASPTREVKISEHIDGDPWTLNGVITRFGVHYGGLSYQITGVKELTDDEGATVGNDWTITDQLDPETVKKISAMTERIGTGMGKSGFRGLFGLDFIIREGEPYLIEINARQPASTSIHSKQMIQDSSIPLLLLHIAEFMSSNKNDFIKFINSVLNENYDKSTMISKLNSQNRKLGEPLKISQFLIRNRDSEEIVVNKEIKYGTYNTDGELTNREGYNVNQIDDSGGYLLIGAEKGRKVTPGSEIARIQKYGTVLKEDRSISKKFNPIIEMIRSSHTDPLSKTLPDNVANYIDHYRNLKIKDLTVVTPYYINTKRVRGGLRALVGKGTPKEIEEETLIYMKLRGYTLEGKGADNVREFMNTQGIGIECSGFVCQVLDHWLKESKLPNLSHFIDIESKNPIRKILRKMRYIENINADTLTGKGNARKIKLREIRPGDLIRLRGAKRGFHVTLITKVTYSTNGELLSFEYTHSTPHYGQENGIRTGQVVITNLEGELKDQKWEEYDHDAEQNWTYNGLLKDYEDNGLRRLNFIDELEW